MKVKIALTIDIDNDAYQQRHWPNAKWPFEGMTRAAFIRDEVQGQAAASVVHQLLSGLVEEGGCLKDYRVSVWDDDEAQAAS